MELESRETDGALILSVKGSMDADNAHEFEAFFQERIGGGHRAAFLDMGELDYISSAGLRVVMKMVKKVEATGADIGIIGLQGVVRDVFKVTGFLSLFKVYETAEDAGVAG